MKLSVINLFISCTIVSSCSIEELEERSYACYLSEESNFGDGGISCVGMQAPQLSDYAINPHVMSGKVI